MEAKLSGKNIIIKLPVDEVVSSFNANCSTEEAPMRVKFKRKFAASIVSHLTEVSNNNHETEDFIDHVLDFVYDQMITEEDKSIKYPDEFNW
ncbi:hypothetical protein [Bacillus phage SDFMU_Pbc]|uniref:Uncharacterized protein n=1 Tax=Bacillus phage SDFMU_Pbc TaxID=3076135 RepID=A0AA96KRF9_9CAUD|nr:hypothetical protein [Bacillus phage SDFMU_Pbc]